MDIHRRVKKLNVNAIRKGSLVLIDNEEAVHQMPEARLLAAGTLGVL